jgi:2,3-dihydroxybenzoate-AMP ligase
MLDGVVPFPPEFAARYRAAGYWRDRTLRDVFGEVFTRYADRVAIIDGDERISYRQLDERSTRMALSLLDLGVRPLDRIVVQLPNTALFCYLYFALQKIGAIPILALPSHRFREVSQFVAIGGAIGCAVPARHRDFDYVDMVTRIAKDNPELRLCLVQGDGDGISLNSLLERTPHTTPDALDSIVIDPADPAVFLLSGGTTGIPKLIPRSHNDYAYNSALAVSVCDVRAGDVLLTVLPIEHNLPLACPGLQGFLLRGATTVLSTSTRPDDVFALIQRHRVSHIHLVPALLIRWVNAPTIGAYDLSSMRVVQSGGQRLQPETRLRAERMLPNCTVQENFGMAEGLLLFVRLDDDPVVRRETCGRAICPDDEIRLLDDDGRRGTARRGRRAVRARPVHAAGILPGPGAQRARVHPGRLLPLRRPDVAAPVRQLRGGRAQEGSHQPRRREDQRRRGRKPDPRPSPGGQRRLRAGAGRATG